MISIIITAKPVILLNIPSLMVFVQTTKYYYTSIICNDDIDSSTCTLVNVVELSSSKITKKKKIRNKTSAESLQELPNLIKVRPLFTLSH